MSEKRKTRWNRRNILRDIMQRCWVLLQRIAKGGGQTHTTCCNNIGFLFSRFVDLGRGRTLAPNSFNFTCRMAISPQHEVARAFDGLLSSPDFCLFFPEPSEFSVVQELSVIPPKSSQSSRFVHAPTQQRREWLSNRRNMIRHSRGQ